MSANGAPIRIAGQANPSSDDGKSKNMNDEVASLRTSQGRYKHLCSKDKCLTLAIANAADDLKTGNGRYRNQGQGEKSTLEFKWTGSSLLCIGT